MFLSQTGVGQDAANVYRVQKKAYDLVEKFPHVSCGRTMSSEVSCSDIVAPSRKVHVLPTLDEGHVPPQVARLKVLE